MKFKRMAFPYGFWMVVFIVLPLGLVAWYALTTPGGGLTLEHFRRFFSPTYLKIFGRSLWLSLVSTIICLGLGYPAAALLASRQFKRAGLFLVLFLLPMWMNFLLRTYAWLFLLQDKGLIWQALKILGIANPPQMVYTRGAVVLGMVYNFLPFMVLPIYTAMTKTDPQVLEAARDLGAGPRRVFSKVMLPLSMPGIISGIIMVFMPAASTFAISSLLGGAKEMYIGDLIENQFISANNPHFGAAVSIILMVIMLLSMRFINGATEADLEAEKHRRKAPRLPRLGRGGVKK